MRIELIPLLCKHYSLVNWTHPSLVWVSCEGPGSPRPFSTYNVVSLHCNIVSYRTCIYFYNMQKKIKSEWKRPSGIPTMNIHQKQSDSKWKVQTHDNLLHKIR